MDNFNKPTTCIKKLVKKVKYSILVLEERGHIMSILEGFKTKKLVIGSPYLTVTDNGVSFNKSALDKLGYAEFVKLLINEETHMVALQVCDENDPDKIGFLKGKSKDTPNVRWNYHDFVVQLQGWMKGTEFEGIGFKVPGQFYSEENVLLFNFQEAVIAS